ncbi:hypothetical protein K8R62_02105 [bacterium]|nr:hypothetical protein [bacterium]
MNLFKNKILKNKKNKLAFIFIFSFLFIIIPKFAHAAFYDFAISIGNIAEHVVLEVIGFFINIFVSMTGIILGIVVDAVISFSGYNNFIHEPAIGYAWQIVSSFCNMFFILIVLVIAFANILNIDSYRIKSTLPKVIIMAILINFSLMICGLLIDFSQIFMMTFVNAIGTNGGNYIEIFKIDGYFKMLKGDEWTGEVDTTSAILGMILALIFMLIALVTLVYILMIIVMRIVMLWIYSILSPFAFVLSAFPAGKPYASKWWDRFIKELIAGPVLLFFVWLAFYTVSKTTAVSSLSNSGKCFGPLESFCPDSFLPFFLGVAMLIVGLKITQEIGSVTGGLAGSAMNRVQQGRGLALKGMVGGADWLNRKQGTVTGFDLNAVRFKDKIAASMDRSKSKDLSGMDIKASGRLQKGGWRGALGGITASGWADQYARGFMGYKGVRSAVFGNQGQVVKLRKKSEENKDKANRIFSEEEYDNEMINWEARNTEVGSRASTPEERQRLIDDHEKLEQRKEMAEDSGFYYNTAKEASKERENFMAKSIKQSNRAADYTVHDYEGKKAVRSATAEEQNKITSNDESELIAQFKSAVSQNNAPMARALSMAIAKVGGGNALLDSYGYQASSGLNREEAEIHKGRGTYDQYKGLNDFMRDVFQDSLGMDEQNTLALQNDLGGIGESINHEYLTKSVAVNPYSGQLEQASSTDREKYKLIEKLKRDPEKVVRNANRLDYGAEDKDTGKFKWAESGLAWTAMNAGTITREINNNRFNRSAAKAMAEEDAAQKLIDKMAAAGISEVQDGDHAINFQQFKEKLQADGKSVQQETADELLRRVE